MKYSPQIFLACPFQVMSHFWAQVSPPTNHTSVGLALSADSVPVSGHGCPPGADGCRLSLPCSKAVSLAHPPSGKPFLAWGEFPFAFL